MSESIPTTLLAPNSFHAVVYLPPPCSQVTPVFCWQILTSFFHVSVFSNKLQLLQNNFYGQSQQIDSP
jgi:hypothetical protein